MEVVYVRLGVTETNAQVHQTELLVITKLLMIRR